jgi:hypothetical protein
MDARSVFGKHQIMPGNHKVFTLENFSLGAKREKDGWVLLNPYPLSPDVDKKPDFTEGEYFQTGKSNTIHLAPSLPEKPLVFKGSKLHLGSGQKLTFFLTIPLSVQVFFSKIQSENLIKEYPTKRLSDTWFGEVFGGEPAYSLGTVFYMSLKETESCSLEAICPIIIYNNSPGVLEVQRLIIRVENLTLYLKDGNIITSSIIVEYKGKEIISSASYHYSKVFHGEKAEILANPRSDASKSLLNINFHFIKNIYKQEL